MSIKSLGTCLASDTFLIPSLGSVAWTSKAMSKRVKRAGVCRAALLTVAIAKISLGVVGSAAAESPPGCSDATISVSVTPNPSGVRRHGDNICYSVCYGATGSASPCDIADLTANLILPNGVSRPVLASPGVSILAGQFFCCPSADPRCNPALTQADYCYSVNHVNEVESINGCPPLITAGIGRIVAYTQGTGNSRTPTGNEVAPCATANNEVRHACCEPCSGTCTEVRTAALCPAPRTFTPTLHCNQVTCTPRVCPGPVPPCEGGQVCSTQTGQCVNQPDAPLSTPCEVETPPNQCTIDHCSGTGTCVRLRTVCDENPNFCNDNNICTLDVCDFNLPPSCCEHRPIPCPNRPCFRVTGCDPIDGCQYAPDCTNKPVIPTTAGDQNLSICCPDEDENSCTTETCDKKSGLCRSTPDCTTAADCDDQNECTDNFCVDGCCEYRADAANGMNCGDAGTQCTNQDTCLNGACQDNGFKSAGTACGSNSDTDCTKPDMCSGDGACQPNNEANGSGCTTDGDDCTNDACAGGVCTHTNTCCVTNEDCDDGNPCTDDSCENVTAGLLPGGCVFNNNSDPCDDENACTTDDVCDGGVCVGGAPGCVDSDGCCPPACDNNNDIDCLFLACDTGQGDCCAAHPNPGCGNIACCQDVCAIDAYCCDVAWDGQCADEALSNCGPDDCGIRCANNAECGDDNPCTDDACVAGSCEFSLDDTNSCNDGDACTVGDACTDGFCAGRALVCNDRNACTTDSCNPSTGCVYMPNVSCDDSNECTDDGCDPAAGCTHTNNTAPCDDGNPNTTNDACSNGVCVGGSPPVAVLKWESVLNHSPNQPVPISLEIPDTGLFSESRSGIKKIVVTFDGAVNPVTAIPEDVLICGNDVNNLSVDLTGVEITMATSAGDTKLEISFTPPLPNFVRYRITISTNIQGMSGDPIQAGTGGLSRILTALQGDAAGGGDRRVNATDLGLVRSLVGTNPIDPLVLNHIRADVNNDGRINATDLGLVRGRVGQDARNILEPVCP